MTGENAGTRGRILVVDDEPASRVFVCKQLRDEGFEVEEAESGREALDKASSWDPELILMDIDMPGMDGIEACRRLKTLPRVASIPVIFFTGHRDDDPTAVEALTAGGRDFVSKDAATPVLVARLLSSLELYRDTTRRAEEQRLLSEHEALLSGVLESVPDGIATIRESGEIERINQAIEHMFGFPDEDLIGTTLERLVPGSLVAPVLAAAPTRDSAEKVASVVEPWRELEGVRRDGSCFPLEMIVTEITVGRRRRFTAVLRDLTQRKKIEAKREEDVRLRELAAVRLTTAAEIHDGILQTLTGACLQLEVIARDVERDPSTASEGVRAVKDGIAAEQRELRLFVEELRLESDDVLDGEPPLSERFQALLGRLEEIWGVEFRLDTCLAVPVSNSRERELLRIVQEAVVNASRHGKASLVTVSVSTNEEGVAISVADNGSGFPFLGRLDHVRLFERQLGPVSLMGRVAAIGGSLSIDSSSDGAEVSVILPPGEDS